MSVLTVRGGIPATFRGTSLGTTAVKIRIADHLRKLDNQEGRYSPGISQYLVIQNHDTTNQLKVYWYETHKDDDEHYVSVRVSAAGIPGIWEGPAEVQELWVAAAAATVAAYEVTAFLRRG